MPQEHESLKQKVTKAEYNQAFDELAALLFRQYRKKKQAELTNDSP